MSLGNTDEARKSLEHGAVAEGPACYGVSMGVLITSHEYELSLD